MGLFLVDNIAGVSKAKHTGSSLTASVCTHLVMGWRRREQWNYGNHDGREAAEQYGEMEVVDTAQHCRGRVHNATSRRREGKLQHHPTHTHHQTHHQAPEGTLNTHKHTQVTLHASPGSYVPNFLQQLWVTLGRVRLVKLSLPHHDSFLIVSSTHTCSDTNSPVSNLQQRMWSVQFSLARLKGNRPVTSKPNICPSLFYLSFSLMWKLYMWEKHLQLPVVVKTSKRRYFFFFN